MNKTSTTLGGDISSKIVLLIQRGIVELCKSSDLILFL